MVNAVDHVAPQALYVGHLAGDRTHRRAVGDDADHQHSGTADQAKTISLAVTKREMMVRPKPATAPKMVSAKRRTQTGQNRIRSHPRASAPANAEHRHRPEGRSQARTPRSARARKRRQKLWNPCPAHPGSEVHFRCGFSTNRSFGQYASVPKAGRGHDLVVTHGFRDTAIRTAAAITHERGSASTRASSVDRNPWCATIQGLRPETCDHRFRYHGFHVVF